MTDQGPPSATPPAESAGDTSGDQALRAVFTDQFARIQRGASSLTADLPPAVATWRPDEEANTIGWLLWHTARVIDAQLADLVGADQVWTAGGAAGSWAERFALPFAVGATGYGQDPAEAGLVAVDAELLAGYQHAVHTAALAYLARLTAAELDRVVDTNWDPPVTVGVRLISIVGDCLQHLGQAGYVRGLARRAGIG